jgi:serine/threonine-protein kinase
LNLNLNLGPMRQKANGAEFVKHTEVRAQLQRILASPGFQGANRRARLLRYLVEEVLQGRPDSLKELVIATEVFERAPDYDPQVDSLVRVEMGRLRSRLQEYYGQAGASEPVLIEIPKGSYRPTFVFRDAVAEMPEPVTEPEPAAKHRLPAWRWTGAAIVTLAVAATGLWLLRSTAPPLPRSIAVLPFLNLSGDPASEYLGDGISEEVTESLAQSADLRVVARTSAFQYKGKSADIREVGRKLGARAILEGSVGRRGDGLHVVAQLIRASDGYHLWSEAYDAGAAELPSVEARIGQAVREKLDPLAPGTVTPPPNEDPEAHDLYLRAAYEFNLRTVASTRHAIELSQQAVHKDSSYAQPYVLMGSCESQLSTLFVESPREASEHARQDISSALRLDPSNSGAHGLLAMLTYTDDWDWPRAEHEFRATLASGSHGSAENIYGWCLMTRGRFAESRRHLQIASELDPLSLGPQLNMVEEAIAERDYAEARRKVNRILEASPTNFVALVLAGSIALYQGDCPAIVSGSQKLLTTFPQSPYAHISALTADGFCGHEERVAPEFKEILSGHPPGYLSPYTVAMIYSVRGDNDQAMAYLQKAADVREPTILMLKVERAFDRMRQDARFRALERQLGLLD